MSSRAIVAGLQICPGSHRPMTAVQSVLAIENLGLQGDQHAKAESKRQILLIEAETLEKLGLGVGDVKENITTRGLRLMSLPIGARLQVGEAVLEITGECHPCSRMEDLRPGLLEEIGGQRGMLARVAHSGALSVGDAILIEAPSA